MDEKKFFTQYKTLRNHLQKLSLEDSLFVLWSYSQHFAFNNKISNDIEVALCFIQAKSWPEKKLLPWELELLCREVIINSQIQSSSQKSLRSWSYFSGAINKLKDFENEIAGYYASHRNILIELWRIAHRQFPWQTRVNQIQITRYWKIFSDERLSKFIHDKTGLTTKDLYINGMLFSGCYLNHPSVNLPVTIETNLTNTEIIKRFIDVFSLKIEDLKIQILKEQTFDEKFIYAFSPLTSRPMIQMDYRGQAGLVCPIPTQLIWRITSGIYYDICDIDGFGNIFGELFEKYVNDVAYRANTKGAYNIYREQHYKIGKDDKRTSDLVLQDDESILFIECKTKRIKQIAKESILNEKPIEEELEKMSDFIFQIYKTIYDYKNGLYPDLKPNNKNIYPVVLTLENWYAFGDYVTQILKSKISKKLEESTIPNDYLELMPYTITSVADFELLTQVLQSKTIHEVFHKKTSDKEMHMWALESYLHSNFSDELKKTRPLFQEEYESLFKQKHFDK